LFFVFPFTGIILLSFQLKPRITFYIVILADGLDCESIERNALRFRDFGSRNKESVAELFVSLISKVSNYKVHLLLMFAVEVTCHN
jgi:hypothetical protein